MAAPKKKKIERSPLKQKFELRQLITRINEKYGEGSIVLASEAQNLEVKFVSTGCYAVDFATGGGIPMNRLVQIVGGFSAGKTTMTLKTIAEFQRLYQDGYAFFIDVENALDFKYAKMLGVQMDRLLVIRPDSGEQAADILMEMLKQDVPILGVIDSIPAVIPFAEMEESLDKNFMGKHPMLINRMVKLCSARLKKSMTNADAAPTTVIMLNQVREKVGLVFGNPETTPGGRGKDFFSALTLTLRGGDKHYEEVERFGRKRKILVGRSHHCTVTKNKCGGRPFEETEYVYWIKDHNGHKFGTYDNEAVLFDFGLFYGVVQLQKGGKMVYACKAGKIEYAKDAAFIKALGEFPRVARSLYREILKKVREDNNQDDAPAEEVVATP